MLTRSVAGSRSPVIASRWRIPNSRVGAARSPDLPSVLSRLQCLHREEIPRRPGKRRPVRSNPLSPGADISRQRLISRTLALDERAIGDSGPGGRGERALRGTSLVAVRRALQRCRVPERSGGSNARARIGGRDDAVGSRAEASGLLETYPQTRMVSHPVAPYVNHLEFDEPRLIQRAPQEPVQ